MRNDIRNRLLGKYGCGVLGAWLLISQIALAQIIPSSRLANWTLAGVPGGIPIRTNIFVNVLTTSNASYRCLANGMDISAHLLCAITACPPNEVVYIPTGRYTLSNSVSASLVTNVTIRGDGPGKTILVSQAGGGNGLFDFESTGSQTNFIWNVLGSNPIGTTSINLGVIDTGPYGPVVPAVGGLLWIDQTNDYNCGSCAPTDIDSTGESCQQNLDGSYPYSSYFTYECTSTVALASMGSTNGGLVFGIDGTGQQARGDRCDVVQLPDESRGRNLQQLVRVTAINITAAQTNVTFWPPLFWEFDQSKQARATAFESGGGGIQMPTSLVGIENLTISNGVGLAISGTATNNPQTVTSLIFLANADRCWADNVEISYEVSWGIKFACTVQCQIDHCYIHGNLAESVAGYNQPNNPITIGKDGYGFQDQQCTALLFQNNLESHLFIPHMRQQGSVGCVTAYNLFIDMADGTAPGTLAISMDGSHGPYHLMNLYEGNACANFVCDAESGFNTLNRNWIWGTDLGTTYGPSDGTGVVIKVNHFCYFDNIVGNILGTPGIAWGYMNPAVDFVSSTNNTTLHTPYIFQLGFPCIGNPYIGTFGDGSYNLTNAFWSSFDPYVSGTAIINGNFDYAHSNVVWTSGSQALANSYYLSAQPSWWGNALPWPPFDPNNPQNASVTNLPAGYRYIYGVDPPGSSSPGVSSPGNLSGFKFFHGI